MSAPHAMYCDGGVIGPNPSAVGGTWAYCWVDALGRRVRCEAGAVQPADVGAEAVSNNLTEMYAALRALRSVPPGWRGTLYTDSNVTRQRLRGGGDLSSLPRWMALEVLQVRRQYRGLCVELLGGHPTRSELASGHKRKNKLPVSEHNVWCDGACTEAGRRLRDLLDGN